MIAPEPTVTATEYTVSLLPADNVNHRAYRIIVRRVDTDRWRVEDTMGDFLSMAGVWEAGPWGTRERWVQLHTFGLDEALRLAQEVAPNVTVNGRTAVEVLAATMKEQA